MFKAGGPLTKVNPVKMQLLMVWKGSLFNIGDLKV